MSRNYDDDYGSNFEKFTHRKSKKSGKGHQSRSNRTEKWNSVLLDEDYQPFTPTTPAAPRNSFIGTGYTPKVTNTPAQAIAAEHQFGENTHEIKGVKIDFDGVMNIEKIENERDGVTTYGIKFFFKGKKGLFRIIWFNVNSRLRDSIYNTEYAFWLKLQQGEDK